MHLVTVGTIDGQVAQRSTLTAGHKTILAALQPLQPPRFYDFTPPPTEAPPAAPRREAV